jgi:protein phosphatase
VNFAVGAKTDVGRGRPANEDTFLVDHDDRLYAVADGMGGHRAGEVASATAIDALQAAFAGGAALDEAVEAANAAVFEKASDNLDMRGMGTTLTAAALLDDHRVLLGHVGDSRAYLMRDGAVTRITEDHSLVEQLVREGRLSPEEASSHPQKAIITRALGIDPEVEVDTYPVDLRPGDRLLLCSDGLTNMVADTAIAGILSRQPDPQQAAEQLVDMANEAGGRRPGGLHRGGRGRLRRPGSPDPRGAHRGMAARRRAGPGAPGARGVPETGGGGAAPP